MSLVKRVLTRNKCDFFPDRIVHTYLTAFLLMSASSLLLSWPIKSLFTCSSKNMTVINKESLNGECLSQYKFVANKVNLELNSLYLPFTFLLLCVLSYSPYLYWWINRKRFLHPSSINSLVANAVLSSKFQDNSISRAVVAIEKAILKAKTKRNTSIFLIYKTLQDWVIAFIVLLALYLETNIIEQLKKPTCKYNDDITCNSVTMNIFSYHFRITTLILFFTFNTSFNYNFF